MCLGQRNIRENVFEYHGVFIDALSSVFSSSDVPFMLGKKQIQAIDACLRRSDVVVNFPTYALCPLWSREMSPFEPNTNPCSAFFSEFQRP